MGVSALFLVTGALCFLVAGYRGVLRARGRRKPTETPLIVSMIAVGLAFVFLAPVTQAFESALLPSLGRLLSNACTLVAAYCWLHMMVYVRHPTEQVAAKMRTRLITLLIAITVLVVMFFASSRPTGLGIFAGLYRSQPTLAVYAVVYTGYLGSVMIDLGILALRSVRGARAWLRLGMILIAAGCVLAIGYLAAKVIGVLRELVTDIANESFCSSAFATPGCTFAVGMPALAVLLLILGATVPTLGPRLEHLLRAVRDQRSFRRLRPLWETLHADLAPVTPGHPPGSTPGDEISERLYQRVIAIRDGLLALAPYRDHADTHRHRQQAALAGLTDRRRAAAIEAADIRAALHRQRHTMLPRTTPAERHDTLRQNDLTSELHWLTQVSDALVRDELGPARGY